MEVYEHLTTALIKHEVGNFKNWFYSVVRTTVAWLSVVARASRPLSKLPRSCSMRCSRAPPRLTKTTTQKENGGPQTALARVGEGQRRCLELFYLEGHSYAEVARRSGYTANEVKSHIQNGKRSLRILLRPRPQS